MSYQEIQDLNIIPSVIRDFFQPFAKSADFKIDLWQEHGVCGLDIFIHNKGAASLTVLIDKGGISASTITVEAGDTFAWDNIKYALVEVVSAVAYDLVMAGVHVLKRKRRV